jgi:hypothetical protein
VLYIAPAIVVALLIGRRALRGDAADVQLASRSAVIAGVATLAIVIVGLATGAWPLFFLAVLLAIVALGIGIAVVLRGVLDRS